jgi:hypothetical protein
MREDIAAAIELLDKGHKKTLRQRRYRIAVENLPDILVPGERVHVICTAWGNQL